MSHISERAMLVNLTICQWSARKLDKSVTDKVHAEHHAADDAGRYNKQLVSKHAMADLAKVASDARALHYKMTLPWQDNGGRLLSALGWQEYTDGLRKLHSDFDQAADRFAAGYEDFVSDARLRLNGLFKEGDYPAARDVRSRFTFKADIEPIPQAADFRVDLGEAQADSIRSDIEKRANERMATAMRDVWQRIAEHVGHMAERLRQYKPAAGKGDKSEGVFRDSLVDNVRELTAILPALNFMNDPALSRIAERMAAELVQDDASTLRDNPVARASVADAAEAILRDVSDYLA